MYKIHCKRLLKINDSQHKKFYMFLQHKTKNIYVKPFYFNQCNLNFFLIIHEKKDFQSLEDTENFTFLANQKYLKKRTSDYFKKI